MPPATSPWIVDMDDPRAPPQELWDRLTEEERDAVVGTLPSTFPVSEAHPPEGDDHTEAVYGARTELRRFFEKTGRRVYVGTNLPIYYPGLAMFSPDVIAVLDVGTHPRSSWMVSREGKGLDLALEVVVLGDRRKDNERNVERYARLGIQEYFVFDRPKLRLHGYRLRGGSTVYEPLVPQHGHYASTVLGLDLVIARGRLRFYSGDAAIPGAGDLIQHLEGFVDDLEDRLAAAEQRAAAEAERAAAEAERAAAEAERAAAEAERAEKAEAQIKELTAELERLKR
jgi:Uma2 family endonuclease